MNQAGGGGRSGVRALVLVPTRELAIQVAEAVHRYGRELGAKVLRRGVDDCPSRLGSPGHVSGS